MNAPNSAPPEPPPGVVITPAAAEMLARLQDRHGPVMFHQSGGCCDGSSPMCYPRGDFLIGDRDVLLGLLDVGARPDEQNGDDGVPVWISGRQYQTWKHTQLVIDVVPGRGGGFSLEAPDGVRFLSRGRVFTDAEKALLQAIPVITGAAFERGERPLVRGEIIALDKACAKAAAPETCRPGSRQPQ